MSLLTSSGNKEKISHAYCHYRLGSPQAACAGCAHYQGNSCQIVQDPIRPDMVCDFYVPRPGAVVATK